jgi:hypothetical protein
MNYGLYLSNFGEAINARLLAELAMEAENYGWDGFFLWDHILESRTQKAPLIDPWIALTAMAMTTQRIKIGTSVTPVNRRRPWVLARQTASLDQLSNGRLIFGVGLGYPPDVEFGMFGEETNDRLRAEKLDEGLTILSGLWTGKPFSFSGKHYQLEKMTFKPPSFQQPRPPVWVAGFWPNPAPFRRAARWDGVFPLKSGGGLVPTDLVAIQSFLNAERQKQNLPTPECFDFITVGSTPGNNPKKARLKVQQFAEVGATWWLESLYLLRKDAGKLLERIRLGPPR